MREPRMTFSLGVTLQVVFKDDVTRSPAVFTYEGENPNYIALRNDRGLAVAVPWHSIAYLNVQWEE